MYFHILPNIMQLDQTTRLKPFCLPSIILSRSGQQLAQYYARFTNFTKGTQMFLYSAQVLKQEVQFPSSSTSLHSGFPITHLLSFKVYPKQHCLQIPFSPLISQQSFSDSTHYPFLIQQPLQHVKHYAQVPKVQHFYETFLHVPFFRKTHRKLHSVQTCSSQSQILHPGSTGLIRFASESLHPPSSTQQPRQHPVHYPVFLLKYLHSLETGMQRLSSLKVHLSAHSRHFNYYQFQILHPRSVGPCRFEAENSHTPSIKSYPLQQSTQFPQEECILQLSDTGTQISSVLKTHLSEHWRQIQFCQSQVLHPMSGGGAKFFSDSSHLPSIRSYPAQQVKQKPSKLSHVRQQSLTGMHNPIGPKQALSAQCKHVRPLHFAQKASRVPNEGSFICWHCPSTIQYPWQQSVHCPVLLSHFLHKSLTGWQRPWSSKQYLTEHQTQRLSQNLLQPRSRNFARPSRMHWPLYTEYPKQHSQQIPTARLKFLHQSVILLQILLSLKKYPGEHSMHSVSSQVLHPQQLFRARRNDRSPPQTGVAIFYLILSWQVKTRSPNMRRKYILLIIFIHPTESKPTPINYISATLFFILFCEPCILYSPTF